MTLDDLEKVAREAWDGPWSWNPAKSNLEYPTIHDAFGMELFYSTGQGPQEENAVYIATFNPQLLAVMIAELKAARKMVKSGRRIILRGQVIPDAPMQSYVLATEATDKILEGDT
jgi:hypothetical protein